MKIKLVVLSFYLICGISSFSQDNQDNITTSVEDKPRMQKKSAIYLEFLGNSATVFAVNYDRIIKEHKNGFFNATIGYGNYLVLMDSERGFNIPFSLNYTFFSSAKNIHLELGLGSGINFQRYDINENNELRILLTGRIGFKYQRPDGGFFARLAFTPNYPMVYLKHSPDSNPSSIFNPVEREWLEGLNLAVHWVGLS